MVTISDFSLSEECNDYDSCTIDVCPAEKCIHIPVDGHERGTNVKTSINEN